MDKIFVTAPARLHFGFMNLDEKHERKYGSVGMAIDSIGYTIELNVNYNSKQQVECSNNKAATFAKIILDTFKIDKNIRINILESIPSHSGLGSGTQLALAIGLAIAKMFNLDCTTSDIAKILHRGNRSGIGIGSFNRGGFLVDSGKSSSIEPPVITSRIDFPSNWRIILLMKDSSKGMHGKDEKAAFDEIDNINRFQRDRDNNLCSLVMMSLLPSLITKDFEGFSRSILRLQRATGMHFSKFQDGIFYDKDISKIIDFVNSKGFYATGQTSWGPTGFIITDSETSAHKLSRNIKEIFNFNDIFIKIVGGLNSGAVFSDKNNIKIKRINYE